jgi:hypothetical protein
MLLSMVVGSEKFEIGSDLEDVGENLRGSRAWVNAKRGLAARFTSETSTSSDSSINLHRFLYHRFRTLNDPYHNDRYQHVYKAIFP